MAVNKAGTSPTLRELHERARSPETLRHYLTAVRGILGADAVQLVRYEGGHATLIADASPTEEISNNLLGTAGNIPAVAQTARIVHSKFRFASEIVHLIAADCLNQEWMLVWLRLPEETPPSAVAGIVELALFSLPKEKPEVQSNPATPVASAPPVSSSPASVEVVGDTRDLLPGISSVANRSERLTTFARWLGHRLGASELYLLRKQTFGWRIAASAGPLPSRTGPLAHAILHSVKQEGSIVAIEEIRRLSGHPLVQTLQWSPRHAVVLAGGEDLAPDPAVQKLAGQLLFFIDTPFTPFSALKERWEGNTKLRRKILIAGGVLLCGILALPFHQRVRTQVVVEPAVRRFVAAPFDGILKKVYSRGGDIVEEGQLLAELDERELTKRLSELDARLSSAILQNTTELESSNYGEAAIRSLDAASLNHERELLRHKKAHLKLLSPMRGVVVTGELERSEGATVELGRTLLEIAPLERLLVEAAVLESDISLIRPGMNLDIQLYAFPDETFKATVQRVQLRSETRDGQNVFLVEAEIPNREDLIRPGMKGRAVIFADRQPLVWSLLRKPWQAVRKWIF